MDLVTHDNGSLAVSTCKTSVFRIVFVSRIISELGVNDDGDGKYLVTVVVVVMTFSRSSLPISCKLSANWIMKKRYILFGVKKSSPAELRHTKPERFLFELQYDLRTNSDQYVVLMRPILLSLMIVQYLIVQQNYIWLELDLRLAFC